MILLWLGMKPRTRDDEEKLARGLSALTTADPSLAVKTAADGWVMLGAGGEEQLETAVDRLVHEFKIEAAVTGIEIAYKEALTRGAVGEAKYAKRSGGRGHYAHVKLAVEPGEPHTGFVFENAMFGGPIPGGFVTSIAEGAREACDRGVLAGHPIEDVRVTLSDGSYHEVDSSATAFRIAAAMAFADAAKKAQPVLLEPIMHVSLVVPVEYVPRAEQILSARRGEVGSGRSPNDWQTVLGRVPLAGTFGLGAEVRGKTGGRGICTTRFSHYAPAAHAGDDGDRDTPVREPRYPRTPPRLLRAAVPEPDEDWPDDDTAVRDHRA